MRQKHSLWLRLGVISCLPLFLASCAITPKSGPTTSAVIASDGEQSSDSLPISVIEVDNQVVQALFNAQQQQSFTTFTTSKGVVGTIGAGDILQITLWEASPALLFPNSNVTASGANMISLPEQMVDKNGNITVPFVGTFKVAQQTPVQVQNYLRARLKGMANQPQVLVQVKTNNSENVTVLRQGNSVRLPLTAHGERILDAVAAVGGVDTQVQNISVQLTRNHEVKTISLASLVTNPEQNIPLQAGDVVYLMTNPLSFTAMGAVGKNQEVYFSAQGLSLAQALGRVEGLDDSRADPKGVFIFRYTELGSLPAKEQQTWLAQGYNLSNQVPTIYRINLKDPQAFFWLQKFPIKDQDVVYISNAPFAEFTKFVRSVYYLASPAINTVRAIDN
ncbi:polysaccharide biosynthesis/export family protein [Psittacicella gerlachiana]|uniref:Sugar ABC transporter substrate-binding protein n=1 Tax=Psittacicella gerlachiana TaxID=2028574 RepID=A0A3A1YQ75_9GAMM|nr:polysaccharide biosynthesis/export family protein [Psittacicella gerlachiana]RIY38494.1 sugar ABC transporter substrate-binding protein [Psittacicella gerlachiana]